MIHNFEFKQKRTSRLVEDPDQSQRVNWNPMWPCKAGFSRFHYFNSGKLGIQLKILVKLQND